MPLDPYSSKAERTLVFGPEENLVATLTPALPGAASARVAVLLTNVGLNPRCGPYRVNVELAREFARHGVPSLRLDLSGLGDSQRPSAPLPQTRQWVLDLRAAMDELQSQVGIDAFVMVGICSGADLAYLAAPEEPRLRGLVLFDPYLYPTRRTALLAVLYRVRAMGPLATLRRMAGRIARIGGRIVGPGPRATPEEEATLRYGPGVPTLDEFAGRLGTIVDRGTRVRLLYSGSYPYYYNYAQQAADNLRPYGLAAQVESAYLREADHVLMGMRGRLHFIEQCVQFTARWFELPAAPAGEGR